MSLLEEKAKSTVAVIAGEPGMTLAVHDSGFFDSILELFKKLLPLLGGCFNAHDAAEEMQKPSRWVVRRLRQQVRWHNQEDTDQGFFTRPTVSAILQVAKETSEQEFEALFQGG